MKTDEVEILICTICRLPKDAHDSGIRHSFTPVGTRVEVAQFVTDRAKSLRPNDRTIASSLPFDPVLRQALIDARVITADQLQEAETKIKAITGGVSNGNPGP